MRRLVIESCDGHYRLAVAVGSTAVAFRIQDLTGGLTGGLYRARVSRLAPEINGAFLELPGGGQAFLPHAQAHTLYRGKSSSRGIGDCVTEGEAITVKIVAEARPEDLKLPVASARLTKAERRSGDCVPPLEEISPPPGPLERAVRWGREFEIQDIVTDHPEVKGEIAARFPDLPVLLRMATHPLFDEEGLADQFANAFEDRVALPSGGHLLIEETRSGVMIDVNSGAAPGGSTPATARRTTNVEAASRIPAEILLRNLSGLIVVDFIEPRAPIERTAILARLDKDLATDPLPVRRTGFSKFGVVELSRPRKGPSLASARRTGIEAAAQTETSQ